MRRRKKAGCFNAALGCLTVSVLGVFGFVSCIEYLNNKNSQFDFHSVQFSVSFPLVDKFGNSSESIVARGTYFRDTVDRINFDNIIPEDAFKVADDVLLHSTMKY